MSNDVLTNLLRKILYTGVILFFIVTSVETKKCEGGDFEGIEF